MMAKSVRGVDRGKGKHVYKSERFKKIQHEGYTPEI